MIRMIAFIALLAIVGVSGCHHRPFQFRGDMQLSGDIDASLKNDNTASRLTAVTVSGSNCSDRRIAILEIDGLLINRNVSGFGSMGENPVALFREKLDVIACDPSIAAIVLRINSPGGGVTATDIMGHDLMRLKLQRQIPVVACHMDVGAGGAYYLSCCADVVIAHPTSVVGGIGVILNAYNVEDAMGQIGIVSRPVKSGEMIDTLTPDREMQGREREMLQAMATSFHQRFITHIKSTRPRITDDSAFDGRVLTGHQALEVGLIDHIGYLDDAIATARELGGVESGGGVVMYRRDNDRAHTALDISPNDPLKSPLIDFKVPGLDRSSMPMFLYLWQSDPSLAARTDG